MLAISLEICQTNPLAVAAPKADPIFLDPTWAWSVGNFSALRRRAPPSEDLLTVT
jgi:LDH2 family malate/lactate/ureidoglycolate dehydrogenase